MNFEDTVYIYFKGISGNDRNIMVAGIPINNE